MKLKKGTRVNVYLDPFTVSDLEDVGTIITTPEPQNMKDVKQRPMYRCVVRFDGEKQGYHRTVSEPENEI